MARTVLLSFSLATKKGPRTACLLEGMFSFVDSSWVKFYYCFCMFCLDISKHATVS